MAGISVIRQIEITPKKKGTAVQPLQTLFEELKDL